MCQSLTDLHVKCNLDLLVPLSTSPLKKVLNETVYLVSFSFKAKTECLRCAGKITRVYFFGVILKLNPATVSSTNRKVDGTFLNQSLGISKTVSPEE